MFQSFISPQTMIKYAVYRFNQPDSKNPISQYINSKKTNLFDFVDVISGKKKTQFQYQLLKLNRQRDLIKFNIDFSHSCSSKFIDILR